MDFKTFIEFNELCPANKARLLKGPPGIGKSMAVKQFADKIEYEFVDLRLSELEPSDLVGMPYIENGLTKYAQPWWWPTHGKVVVLLDEVDRAREEMQPVAMQLTLDRRAGGRNLPDGVIVFAACNGEKFMTSAIDQALMNRFAAFDFTPSAEEWLRWAEGAGVHESVVNFIRSDKNMLDTPENLIGVPNISVPTRRSWSDLGMFMNQLEAEMKKAKKTITDHEYLHQFAQPYVGLKPAMTYARWVKEKYQVISAKDVFSGKVKAKNINILQISNVLPEVVDLFMAATSKEQGNCLNFFINAGHEAFAALFSALPKEAAPIIEKFPEADKFIKDNVAVLKQHVQSDNKGQ